MLFPSNIFGKLSCFPPQVKYITEAEQKYDSLLKTLDPQLALNYQKRRDEVIEKGGLRIWTLLIRLN